MIVAIETCANCGESIGRLETPHVWQNQVVCSRCHAKLAPPIVAYAEPDYEEPEHEVMDYRDPVVIEQTAKRFKAMQAIGVVALIGGTGLIMFGAATSADLMYGIGCLGAVGGVVIYLMGRIAAWWNHG